MNTIMASRKYEKYFGINVCNKSWMNKTYSFVVAALPVLASYTSGIPGFSVADICLVLFFLIAMVQKSNGTNCYSIKINLLFFGMVLIIMFSLIACVAGLPLQISDVVIRTTRYTFYIAVTLFTSKKLVNLQLLKKCVKVISVIATLFIILQALIYFSFGIVIKGFLPNIPLYTSEYSTYDYASAYRVLNMYRPTSFFLEPAHYARYCIIGIVLFLFSDKVISNRSMWCAALISFGIVLSTSSQGYLLLAVILTIFLFSRVRYVKSNVIRILMYVSIISLPLIVYYLLQNSLIMAIVQRSLSGGITESSSAIGARLGGFLAYFDLPFFAKFIGTGFGNIPTGVWCSSAAYWLYGSGFIVFIIFILFLLSSLYQLKGSSRYILLVFSILFFTDDSFYSYMCVLFLSFIIY